MTEQSISASGLASERVPRRVKLTTWWTLPEHTHRHDELRAAHQQITNTLSSSAGLHHVAYAVLDHGGLFGLAALLDALQDITALAAGAILSGTVRCTIGRDLILDTSQGPLLADTRLLVGWPLHPSTAALTGLTLRACHHTRNDDAAQPSLF